MNPEEQRPTLGGAGRRLAELAASRGMEINPASLGIDASFGSVNDIEEVHHGAPQAAPGGTVQAPQQQPYGYVAPAQPESSPAQPAYQPQEPSAVPGFPGQAPGFAQSPWSQQQPWQQPSAPQAQAQRDPALNDLRQSVQMLTDTVTRSEQQRGVQEFREQVAQLPPAEQEEVYRRLEVMALEEERDQAMQQAQNMQPVVANLLGELIINKMSQRYGVKREELAQFPDPYQALAYAEHKFNERNHRTLEARRARTQARAGGQQPAAQPGQPWRQPVTQQQQYQPQQGVRQSHAGQHRFEAGGAPSRPAQQEKPKSFAEAAERLRSQPMPVLSPY